MTEHWARDLTAVQDYSTYSALFDTSATVYVTSLTEYIDTTITNIEKQVTRTVVTRSSVYDHATEPGPRTKEAPLPIFKFTEQNGTVISTYGTAITSPAPFYIYSTVTVISVPAVIGKDGHPVCATTSTGNLAGCTPICSSVQNQTTTYPACVPTPTSTTQYQGINSYAEAFFGTPFGIFNHSFTVPSKTGVVVTFTTPFVYIAPPDPSTSGYPIFSKEEFGYVPQGLIDWMAKNSVYVSQYPGIASCLPAGPPIGILGGCPPAESMAAEALPAVNGLTSSSKVTITSAGCFHPGSCPTPTVAPAAPVANPNTLTPTAEAALDTGSTSTVAPTLGAPEKSTSVSGPSPNIQEISNTPQNTQPTPTNAEQNTITSAAFNPENVAPDQLSSLHAALAVPDSPSASPPTQSPGLGALIANAMGATAPSTTAGSQDNTPAASPPSTPAYTISIAPSASALIINGVTTSLPLARPDTESNPAAPLVTIGSQPFSVQPLPSQPSSPLLSAVAAQYIIGSQTLQPGGPAITIANTPISIPSSANELHIGSSTIPLPTAPATNPIASAPSAPQIIIGSQILTLGPNGASEYVIGSQTLTPGSPPIIVSGFMNTPSAGASFAPITVGNEIVTLNPTGFEISGTTLTPGGGEVTVQGTGVRLVSLSPSGSAGAGEGLVVGGSTIALGTEGSASGTGNGGSSGTAAGSASLTASEAGSASITITAGNGQSPSATAGITNATSTSISTTPATGAANRLSILGTGAFHRLWRTVLGFCIIHAVVIFIA